MKKFLVLLGILSVLGFGLVRGATGTASTVTTNTIFPISLTAFVPCANGGAGEDVELSGNLHDLFSVTFDGSGGFHLTASDNPQGVTGIGLTTGAFYQGTGVTRSNADSTAGGTNSFTFVNNFRIIGHGSASDLLVHEDFHLTVNPDGTVTSFHDDFSITCR